MHRALVRVVWVGILAHAAFLPISRAGMQIGLGVAIAGLAALAVARRPVWVHSAITLPTAVLVAGFAAAVAVPWLAGMPPIRPAHVLDVRNFAAPLVVFLALQAGDPGEDPAAPRRRALAFVAVWAAAAVVTALVAIIQARTGLDPLHALGLRKAAEQATVPGAPGRYAAIGFFSWYTRLVYALTPIAALAGGMVLAPLSRRNRALFGLAACAAGIAVFLTGARAAWAALAVAALALAVLAGRRLARNALLAALAALVVAGAAYAPVRGRLARALSFETNADRASVWRICAEVVRDHPLTGVGYGALPKRSDPYYERMAPWSIVRDRCHDVFYTAWAEGGPLFAAAVVAWWALLARAFLRLRREGDALGRASATGVIAGLAALFVIALVHDLFWATEALLAIGALLGAGAVLGRPRRPTTE